MYHCRLSSNSTQTSKIHSQTVLQTTSEAVSGNKVVKNSKLLFTSLSQFLPDTMLKQTDSLKTLHLDTVLCITFSNSSACPPLKLSLFIAIHVRLLQDV